MALLLHLLGLPLPGVSPPARHMDPTPGRTGVHWEDEYRILCARMGLPSLLPPRPAPPLPQADKAAPYWSAASGTPAPAAAERAQWGLLGSDDGALWHMLNHWLARLAQARAAPRAAVAPATAAAGTVAAAGDALGGVAWRAPLIMAAAEGLAESEAPRLIQPPAVFQYLVNRFTSCTGGGGRARARGGGDGGDARKSAAVCLGCGQLVWYRSERAAAGGREGACMGHAWACGRGQGVFLSLANTLVFLVQSQWVAEWGSPYLDEHG